MAKNLYKVEIDYGRSGLLTGLFIADRSVVQEAMGKDYYASDILGKHSEVYGEIDEEIIEFVSSDQELISRLEESFPDSKWSSRDGWREGNDTLTIIGNNPLHWIYWEDDFE